MLKLETEELINHRRYSFKPEFFDCFSGVNYDFIPQAPNLFHLKMFQEMSHGLLEVLHYNL